MFDQYQKHASKNFKTFTELDPKQAELLNWVVGLSGETGEVSELVKHHIFGKEPIDKMELAKELGDVLWYLAAICTTTGIDLSAVAELNINKLDYRYNNAGYSAEASAHRHENERAFKDTFIYKCLQAKITHTAAPLNVIFVGPDGSGKTSISSVVAQRLSGEGFVYHKCDYRQDDKPELALQLLNESNIIFDRFYYPDDIIYSRIVWEREHSEEPMDWNTDYWKKYNKVVENLCNVNTLVIYVDASDAVLQKRAAAWADNYVKVEELQKIRTLYQRWMQFISTLPVIVCTLDTSEDGIEVGADKCVEFIRRAQAVFSNQDEQTYLGEVQEGEQDADN